MEDSEIIKLIKSGNEDALAVLKEKYNAYVFKIASGILPAKEDQEECVNDALLKLWNIRDQLHGTSLKSYLGKTVRNISINYLKAQTAEKRGGAESDIALDELSEFIPAKDSTEDYFDAAELSSLISEFLRKQTPFNRSVFIRRYYSLHSISQISKAEGISESKTASLLLRMRKSLKKYLEKENYRL